MHKQIISDDEKCRWIIGDFDCHVDAAIQHGAHNPMEHIRGFTQSHWMLLSVECLHCIAAAMVINFKWKIQSTNKTQLLASNYGTFRSLVIRENFVPQNGPSTQLIDATSCIKMWDNMIGAEELTHISIYQTLLAAKIGKVINLARSSFKKWSHICDWWGIPVKHKILTNHTFGTKQEFW